MGEVPGFGTISKVPVAADHKLLLQPLCPPGLPVNHPAFSLYAPGGGRCHPQPTLKPQVIRPPVLSYQPFVHRRRHPPPSSSPVPGLRGRAGDELRTRLPTPGGFTGAMVGKPGLQPARSDGKRIACPEDAVTDFKKLMFIWKGKSDKLPNGC